jgi:hypothetical protein
VESVFLVLVFAVLFVVLAVALYVGALFFQSYIYTGPVPGLAWRAPVAAGVLASFFTLWCFVVTRSDARPGDIPYDTIFRFSPRVDMFPEPAPKIWTVKGDGAKIAYVRRTSDNLKPEYRDSKKGGPYLPTGVVALELERDGSIIRFDKGVTEEGGYRFFESADGWVMKEYDNGPTGIPSQSRWGRFLANLGLNLLHAALWLVCFWLLLQFRFNDALGFAFVITLVATVVLLPMILDQAAIVARERSAPGTG